VNDNQVMQYENLEELGLCLTKAVEYRIASNNDFRFSHIVSYYGKKGLDLKN
jgi:hypothetical protein